MLCKAINNLTNMLLIPLELPLGFFVGGEGGHQESGSTCSSGFMQRGRSADVQPATEM